MLSGLLLTGSASGQLFDAFDRHPLRWHLGQHDCGASVIGHVIDPIGGVDRRPCEAVTVSAGHGTHLQLEYRLPPTRVIDELAGRLWFWSAQSGARMGFRVRYPYLLDPATGHSVTTVHWGAQPHRRPGQWDALGVGGLKKPLQQREIALRKQYDVSPNHTDAFRDAYVEAVVVDVYTGPGTSTVRLDDLRVEQMVPVGQLTAATRVTATADDPAGADGVHRARAGNRRVAFARGRVTRIIEHNGEPLRWLRSIGFDAVLLPRTVDDALLREAAEAGMQIYCPPPTTIHPAWEPLLESVAGWYLGTSLDRSQLQLASAEADRIGRMGPRWQRPWLAAAVEDWSRYAAVASALVYDLPPVTLQLPADEEARLLEDQIRRTGRPEQVAIGVQSGPPERLKSQLTAIAASVGAGPVDDYPWHAIWLQVARGLEQAPRAVLFRSTRSLTSGTAEDQRRALALGYINRMLEAVGPLVAAAGYPQPLRCEGAAYRARQIGQDDAELVIATSTASAGGVPLAGDGAELRIELPALGGSRFAWRITGMEAERLEILWKPAGPVVQITSPDVAELIVVSANPATGARLTAALRPLAMAAAMDRWQLSSEAAFQLRADWQSAMAARAIGADQVPAGALAAAASTLADGQPLYRSGNAGATLQLAHRADGSMLRCRGQLMHALVPPGPDRVSCLPLLVPGGVPLQLALVSLQSDQQWGRNALASGDLDQADAVDRTGWTHDRRITDQSRSEVQVVHGPQMQGAGCLRVEVVPLAEDPLPGGYAGTAVRVRSPPVRCAAGQPLRIDARVRTLGFGGPYQGVLVYDSLGGPELGILVRQADQWQHVRLYRHTPAAGEVRVIFEVIGSGEALIDDVQLAAFDPATTTEPRPLRPIAQHEN